LDGIEEIKGTLPLIQAVQDLEGLDQLHILPMLRQAFHTDYRRN
jgi:hypothetical protein